MPFKVIIAGGRDFHNYDLLRDFCDQVLANQTDIEVVSGKATGADTLGEQYAKERGYPVKEFPADWSLGRKAGPLRNKQMADYADACICFHDGKSRGTANMIELAKAKGLKVRVCGY